MSFKKKNCVYMSYKKNLCVYMSYKKNLCVYMSYKKKLCVYMSFNIKRHIYTSVISWCGACPFNDPIWWGNFLRRGKPLKGGRTLGAWVRSLAGLVFGKSVRCSCAYLPMGWCHFLTGCVLFWEMDLVFFLLGKSKPLMLCSGKN